MPSDPAPARKTCPILGVAFAFTQRNIPHLHNAGALEPVICPVACIGEACEFWSSGELLPDDGDGIPINRGCLFSLALLRYVTE
jgi:hypothetical protein